MYRQHVSSETLKKEQVLLEGEAAHHLLHVLRAKEGTEVSLFDGCGYARLYHVAQRLMHGLLLEAKQPLFETDKTPIKVILFACIPKGDRMEWLLEKATELGVTEIVPVMSDRTVVRLDGKQALAKRDRWQRIVEAASRQCGTTLIPTVHPPIRFAETLPIMQQCTTLIVAALIPNAKPLKPVLDALDPLANDQVWGWWCGPEGDFTHAEMETILQHGAIPVTLGPLILRAETAAIYGMANLGCVRHSKDNLTRGE